MSVVSSAVKQSEGTGRWLTRAYALHESLILKGLGILVALGFWEIAVDLGWASASAVSSPIRIAIDSIAYVSSPQFAVDARTSGFEFLGGFGVALLVGIVLGFAIGWFRRLEYFLDPIINFLYASPRIALAPLLIIWFGIGIDSKIAIIFLMSVFPIVINTSMGVRHVDKDLLDVARSLNASDWQLITSIVVPSSVPFIVTGVRISLGVALIGLVVGEFVASTAGIGFTIQQAASSFEVNRVFSGVIIIGTTGVILTDILRHVEARLAKWKAN